MGSVLFPKVKTTWGCCALTCLTQRPGPSGARVGKMMGLGGAAVPGLEGNTKETSGATEISEISKQREALDIEIKIEQLRDQREETEKTQEETRDAETLSPTEGGGPVGGLSSRKALEATVLDSQAILQPRVSTHLQKALGTPISSPFWDFLAQISASQGFPQDRRGAASALGGTALQLPCVPSFSRRICVLFSFVQNVYFHTIKLCSTCLKQH